MDEKSVIQQIVQQLSFVYGKKPIIYFISEDPDIINKVILEANDIYLYENTKSDDFIKTNEFEKACNFIDVFRSKEKYEMDFKSINGEGPAKLYYCKNVHLHMMKNGNSYNLEFFSCLTQFLEKREKIKDSVRKNRTIMFLSSPELSYFKGLENYIEFIEVPLPNSKDIEQMLNSFFNPESLKNSEDKIKSGFNLLIQSLRGLNASQIQTVCSNAKDVFPTLNILTADRLRERWNQINDTFQEQIQHQKEQMVKMNQIIRFVDNQKTADLKGNERILRTVNEVKDIYLDPMSYVGCSPPKGILMAGVPGTGKSFLAEKIASDMGVALLQLDMGTVMGKYIGESEEKLRRALALAQAVAPCVLFIDELEKAFPTGKDAHEVTSRLFGYMLWWMQTNTKPIFIYATANDTNKIDSAFLRSGRFDRKFYTFMPSCRECISILKVRLQHRLKDNPKLFEDRLFYMDAEFERILNSAADCGKFYTGADIESWVNETMISLYQDKLQRKAVIRAEAFVKSFERAMADTRPYGKTNLNSLVHYWLQVKFNGYLPAGDEIIHTDDFDLANRPDKEEEGKEPSSYFRTSKLPEKHYDKQMYQVITGEINRLSKSKIIHDYITDAQKG